MEKVKEIFLQSTIIFILLIMMERMLKSLTHEVPFIKTYWFFLPLLFVVLFIMADEIRKRKIVSKMMQIPAFQLKFDIIISSILLAFVQYWVSSLFNYVEGTLKPALLVMAWIGAIYILWMVTRSIAVYVRKRKNERKSNEKLFLDYPIESEKDDRFNRASFAQRISNIINMRGYSEGLVIGLFGQWGSGKTSVLNLIRKSLKDEIVFHFNPWFFENEKELIRQFFIQFGKAVRQEDGTEQSILLEKLLRVYGEKVASLKVNLGITSLSINQITSFFAGNSFSKDTDIMDLRDSIIELLQKKGRGITVFIDDNDRLNRNETQTVFKLVKLIADFPYTAYILAFDDRLVAKSLAILYEDNASHHKGDSFLEKIIQVPLHMPPADPAVLRSMVFSGIDKVLEINKMELNRDEMHRFVSTWDRSIGNVITTPRMVKRYLNSLLFSIPLLKDEVNTVDQILIESLRVFFPEFYEFVRLNSDLFLTPGRSSTSNKEKIKQYRDQVLEAMQVFNEDHQYVLKIFLQDLFPRTKVVFTDNTYYGHTWDREWTAKQRVCSSEYFERFFKYTVPAGDVPDNWLKNLLQLIESSSDQDVLNELNKVMKQHGMSRLIQKLRYVEETVPVSTAKKLSEMLVTMGSYFSRKDGAFGIVTTWSQAAVLISQLIKRVPEEERVEFSKQILAIAQPISFAKEIFWWMRPSEEKDLTDIIHTEEEIADIAASFIKRIKLATEKIDFLDQNTTDHDVYGLLWIWQKWGTKEEVEDRIRTWFKAENGVERFLCAFLAISYNLETGIPHVGSFGKEAYNAVQVLISPDEIDTQLKLKYTPASHYDEDAEMDHATPYERVAQQFMWIHRKDSSACHPPDFVED
ncbi:KAP family P-loop NTPase fold protein [Neobacillus muris]|uniref:KAP family P-loop NTPase fold protein n=1 Tax=Neobacillus muris TaxID=2941334 RepID=UPI00203A9AB9|nr:P-loop NTPase fold protein [Neobacillus muris]